MTNNKLHFIFSLLFFFSISLLNAQDNTGYPANYAKEPRFKALVYYTTHAEEAHVKFAEQGG